MARGPFLSLAEAVGITPIVQIPNDPTENERRLRACLMNARNILRADGYVYAQEIDAVLAMTARVTP